MFDDFDATTRDGRKAQLRRRLPGGPKPLVGDAKLAAACVGPEWDIEKQWFITLRREDGSEFMIYKFKEEDKAWESFEFYKDAMPGIWLDYYCPTEDEIVGNLAEARKNARYQGGWGA